MTTAVPRTGRPGLTRAAGAARARLGDPIVRLVLGVNFLGGVLALGVVLGFPHHAAVLHGVGIPDVWLLPALVLLTFLAEVTVVRLRHGDAVEALSLYEAALIVDVLLLPPRHALLAAVLGLLIALVVQRRPLVKILFNLGTFAAAVSALIAVVHTVGGTPGTLTPRVVGGMLLGSVAFTIVNLCCMARILGIVNGISPWAVITAEARLSSYMAIGTLATGLPTAELALHSPLLLPFMAMPALAVTYAYRAAAQEADERVRSAVLLQLSQVLAERDDVVRQFLRLVREAFDADLAVVTWYRTGASLWVDAEASDDPRSDGVPPELAPLLRTDEPVLVASGLPLGLRQLLVVPVEAGGISLGSVALGLRRRERRLSTRDLSLLASLANALAAAVRGAEHLNRLVAETSKLQAVVDQSTQGILVVDGDGTVEMWSRALAELSGTAVDEAVGRPLADLLDLPDPADRGVLLPVTPERPVVAVELTLRRRDGETRRVRLAHSAVFDGTDLVRDVVVVGDLTQEYRTERLKSDFIATVSHELRTPLTPIIGYVDLLRSRGDRMTPEKRRQSLDLVADRAAHLLRLVEDLLLASRIGDADSDLTMDVSPGVHDLAAIVRQVVDDLASPRVTVDLPDGPVPTRCDEGRALQVVANLVGNALKYSPDTEEVQVRLRTDGEDVHVEVADRGRGIPADQLDKVFEKFHRVEDPMTMSTSGTGLGLFISRRLARAMGGDITLTSTLNAGSVFTLMLRLAKAKDRSVSAEGECGPSAPPVAAAE
ncbi:MAG TPA: ATP-binding protein [Mycobacteriales bacterium]